MVQLAGIHFKTQAQAKTHVKNVIHTVGIGNFVTKADKEYALFEDLVKRNPYEADIRGVGIDRFQIRENPLLRNSFCVYAIRTNGSETSMSVNRGIHCRIATQHELWTEALRQAVCDQIMAFKSLNYGPGACCSVCGKSYKGIEDAQVDHTVLFEELVDAFVENTGVTPPTEYADCPITGISLFREEDASIKNRWAEYHRSAAHLRLLCADCHKKRSGCVRLRKPERKLTMNTPHETKAAVRLSISRKRAAELLHTVIIHLRMQGLNYEEISAELTRMGIRDDNNNPLTAGWVGTQISRHCPAYAAHSIGRKPSKAKVAALDTSGTPKTVFKKSRSSGGLSPYQKALIDSLPEDMRLAALKETFEKGLHS